MLRPVVAGLDGTPESSAAADWAAREALRRGLPLRLVHAGEGLPDERTPVALPELRAPGTRARHVLRGQLDLLGERYPQVPLTTDQIRRPPGPALIAEAARAELLVLGSQGFGGVSGFFAGSVAAATVAHAERPVVLVRAADTAEDEHLPVPHGTPSTRAPFRDVAVAVDLGQPCDAVLEFAFRAAEYRRAPLRALQAWQASHRRGIPGPEQRAELRADAQRGLTALLEPWQEKFPGVHVRDSVVEGRPAHEIARAAAGAGLLIVGRRRRRAAVGSRTGPVAHALIHRVTCPVTVVPHD
ncbi:universal stress protein [Streptomyces sp. R21]|uniref:Universal stress protein n=1 Tax=Streptomyces sp. R21 TaxID=3238627 RepID=A0AB39P383_9ACTN